MRNLKGLVYFIIFTSMLHLNANDIVKFKAPAIKAVCTFKTSYILYKNTKCYGGGSDFFKPVCIYLNLQKTLGYNPKGAIYIEPKEMYHK